MFTKSIIGFFTVLFFSLASTWAGPVEGIVKDAQGKPLRGAEVLVQTQDGKVVSKLNTDARGHYASANLPAGTYRVDVLVNAVVKASIKNVAANTAEPAQLNFALTGKTMAKNAKHFVWVPADTGTHIGGRWVEVNEDGTSAAGEHIDKAGGRLLEKMQDHTANPRGN
jgi:hypothetical protein